VPLLCHTYEGCTETPKGFVKIASTSADLADGRQTTLKA
jgi:hypothetical protein